MKRIFVVEDDRGWTDYYQRILADYELSFFRDGVAAIEAMDETVPDLLLLDVMLVGPTGFAILNEMQSYPELAKVPVVISSSVDFNGADLSSYGVCKVLDKSKMTPREVLSTIEAAV